VDSCRARNVKIADTGFLGGGRSGPLAAIEAPPPL